jgi:segregation and condensation protein B
VMRTLLTRGLVEEAGTDLETGAHLYRTTTYFLERIGITSLDELPELAPFVPDMDEFDFDEELAASAVGGLVDQDQAETHDDAALSDPDTASNPNDLGDGV